MTQNEYCAKIRDKVEQFFVSLTIWVIYHPAAAVLIIIIVGGILPKLPELCYHWGVMAFYPARFDYSSVCIGGGCP